MLAIKGAVNKDGKEVGHWHVWHLGDPVPDMTRVVAFQADGDELALIQLALDLTNRSRFGIKYSKENGFHFVAVKGEDEKADTGA